MLEISYGYVQPGTFRPPSQDVKRHCLHLVIGILSARRSLKTQTNASDWYARTVEETPS